MDEGLAKAVEVALSRLPEQSTPSKKLPMIGEIGATALLQALTAATNPLQTIVQFRNQNGLRTSRISTESFRPGFELHGLSGNRHRDLSRSVFQHMIRVLSDRCTNLSPEQRQNLLTETFPYISFKELQDLPFTLLRLTPDIPAAYLNQLSSNTELYDQLPIPVKRQIWVVHSDLFLSRVQPVLDSYYFSQMANHTLSLADLLTPKLRRSRVPQLKELAELIGGSLPLYKLVVQYCVSLFQSTGCPHYCTLRAELVLYLRDTGALEIFAQDSSSKLALLVDTLHTTEEELVDPHRIQEIVDSLFDLEDGSFVVEQAIIIAQPAVVQLLTQAIFYHLQLVVENMQEISDFRKHTNIANLSNCLSLGLSAFRMLSTDDYYRRPLGTGVFVTFYGQLIHRLVDDQLREAQDEPPEISEEFCSLILSHPVALKVMMHVCIQRINAEDVASVRQLLKLFARLGAGINGEQIFLHAIVSLPAVSENEKIRAAVIEGFLLPLCRGVAVHASVLEFLRVANAKMSSELLLSYLKPLCRFRPVDEEEARYIYLFATAFHDRVASRVNADNAPFFFEYYYIVRDPKPYLAYIREAAATKALIEQQREELRMSSDTVMA